MNINCQSLKLSGVCGVMYIAAHTYSELCIIRIIQCVTGGTDQTSGGCS